MLEKIILVTISSMLVYIMLWHNLLPPKCFGSLPGWTTTDSHLYLIHNVKNAWRGKKVVTIILLDIASAFPNAVTSRLILNMKQLGYLNTLINFYEAMLKDHHMTLSFNSLMSQEIDIDNDKTRWPQLHDSISYLQSCPCGHPCSWAWQWRGIHRW